MESSWGQSWEDGVERFEHVGNIKTASSHSDQITKASRNVLERETWIGNRCFGAWQVPLYKHKQHRSRRGLQAAFPQVLHLPTRMTVSTMPTPAIRVVHDAFSRRISRYETGCAVSKTTGHAASLTDVLISLRVP